MRKYIELKIDGFKCDLPDNGIGIELTYKNSDGLTPAGSSSDRSLDLPVTKINSVVFQRWHDAQVNDLQGTEFKSMYLSADGIPILIGRAQLKGCDNSAASFGVKGSRYKVALYGDNADWIVQLGDKKLSELDFSTLTHDLTDAIVTNGFTNSYPISKYCYHGWKLKDWNNSRGGGLFAMDALEFMPALFIRTVLDAIFNEIGYTYTSDFFDTIVGKRLILPVLLPENYPAEFADEYLNGTFTRNVARNYTSAGILSAEGVDFNTHTAPIMPPDPFTDSALDPASLTLAGRYTCRASGYYRFTFRCTVDTFVGFTNFDIALVLNNSGGTAAGAAAYAITDGDTFTISFTTYLDIGIDYYTILLFSGGDIGTGDTFNVSFAELEIFADAAEITYGSIIDFKYLLQDWTCAGFLKGLAEMFNLQFEANAGLRNVLFEPKDNYIYNDPPQFGIPAGASTVQQGFLQNPTLSESKWDVSKGTTDTFEEIPNETIFKYKEDSNDATVEQLNENTEFTLHEARYTRDTNRFKKGETVRENSFFAPTLMLLDETIRHEDSLITPLLPILYNEDYVQTPSSTEKVKTFEPRILYFAGIRNDQFIYYRQNLGGDIKVTLPEAFSVNYNDTANEDFSLAYGNIYGRIGLAQRFYLNDMARTRGARTRETFFYFTTLDILNRTFRPRIKLDNSLWILQEISAYNPLSVASTKVILQQEQAQEAVDITNLSSSPITGIISSEAI